MRDKMPFVLGITDGQIETLSSMDSIHYINEYISFFPKLDGYNRIIRDENGVIEMEEQSTPLSPPRLIFGDLQKERVEFHVWLLPQDIDIAPASASKSGKWDFFLLMPAEYRDNNDQPVFNDDLAPKVMLKLKKLSADNKNKDKDNKPYIHPSTPISVPQLIETYPALADKLLKERDEENKPTGPYRLPFTVLGYDPEKLIQADFRPTTTQISTETLSKEDVNKIWEKVEPKEEELKGVEK